jgi:hypothetical protein
MTDDRLSRWQARQDRLAARLRELGAAGGEYRIDLDTGRFWWLGSDGAPLVEADCRALASFALSNGSVMMAWAISSLDGAAVVDAVEGMPDYVEDAGPGEAWELALTAADACGCDFVYRAPSPQNWLFLALWDVRPADAATSVTPPGTPEGHVDSVLDALAGIVAEGPERWRVLARNHGADMRASADYVWKATPHAPILRAVGVALIAAADAPDEAAFLAALARVRALARFADD